MILDFTNLSSSNSSHRSYHTPYVDGSNESNMIILLCSFNTFENIAKSNRARYARANAAHNVPKQSFRISFAGSIAKSTNAFVRQSRFIFFFYRTCYRFIDPRPRRGVPCFVLADRGIRRDLLARASKSLSRANRMNGMVKKGGRANDAAASVLWGDKRLPAVVARDESAPVKQN